MKLITSLILSFLIISCAQQVSSIKDDKDTLEQQSNTGYLLIGVDLSYGLKYIDISGKKPIKLTEEDLRSGKSYFLIDMPAGDYAFKDIGLNHLFTYTLKKGYWDFQVEPGVISYVGHLRVNSYGIGANAELENRSSQALTKSFRIF
jgi:hypothetical protein